MKDRSTFREVVGISGWTLFTLIVLAVSIVGCSAFSIAYFVAGSHVSRQVVQPEQRKNIDCSAGNRIAVETQYRSYYNNFVAAQQAQKADQQNINDFIAANGKGPFPAYSALDQQYAQLQTNLVQDRQAEIAAASDYNRVSTAADTVDFRPPEMPTTLTPGTPAQPLSPTDSSSTDYIPPVCR